MQKAKFIFTKQWVKVVILQLKRVFGILTRQFDLMAANVKGKNIPTRSLLGGKDEASVGIFDYFSRPR